MSTYVSITVLVVWSSPNEPISSNAVWSTPAQYRREKRPTTIRVPPTKAIFGDFATTIWASVMIVGHSRIAPAAKHP